MPPFRERVHIDRTIDRVLQSSKWTCLEDVLYLSHFSLFHLLLTLSHLTLPLSNTMVFDWWWSQMPWAISPLNTCYFYFTWSTDSCSIMNLSFSSSSLFSLFIHFADYENRIFLSTFTFKFASLFIVICTHLLRFGPLSVCVCVVPLIGVMVLFPFNGSFFVF